MTSNSVTEAIYDAGFNSSGRFYEKSTDMLGMTPTRYRSGGINEDIRFAVGECSLGTLLVASSKKGIAAILLGDDPDNLVRELQDRFPKATLIGADREYEGLVARVVGFIEAPARASTCRRYSRHRLPAQRASGAPCRISRLDAPFHMPNSHAGSVAQGVRGGRLARRTTSQWRSGATGGPQRWLALRLRLGRGTQALIAKEARREFSPASPECQQQPEP
jgi:hypothetical protein